MKDSLKKAFPACLGSSIAVTAVQFFRHPDIWGISDLLFNFAFIFIVTTMIVSLCFWGYSHIAKRNKGK